MAKGKAWIPEGRQVVGLEHSPTGTTASLPWREGGESTHTRGARQLWTSQSPHLSLEATFAQCTMLLCSPGNATKGSDSYIPKWCPQQGSLHSHAPSPEQQAEVRAHPPLAQQLILGQGFRIFLQGIREGILQTAINKPLPFNLWLGAPVSDTPAMRDAKGLELTWINSSNSHIGSRKQISPHLRNQETDNRDGKATQTANSKAKTWISHFSWNLCF